MDYDWELAICGDFGQRSRKEKFRDRFAVFSITVSLKSTCTRVPLTFYGQSDRRHGSHVLDAASHRLRGRNLVAAAAALSVNGAGVWRGSGDGGTLHWVHLDVSAGAAGAGGVLADAGAAVILPAQIEVDVLGDDEAARGAVAVFVHRGYFVAAWFLADDGGGVVSEERFQGEEAAADYYQVGFDDAVGGCLECCGLGKVRGQEWKSVGLTSMWRA